jgi:hypothetical protein
MSQIYLDHKMNLPLLRESSHKFVTTFNGLTERGRIPKLLTFKVADLFIWHGNARLHIPYVAPKPTKCRRAETGQSLPIKDQLSSSENARCNSIRPDHSCEMRMSVTRQHGTRLEQHVSSEVRRPNDTIAARDVAQEHTQQELWR